MKSQLMGMALAMAGAVIVSLSANARQYLWTGSDAANDWTDVSNWSIRDSSEQVTEPPKAGDSIWVQTANPLHLNAADAASVAVLNAVDGVLLPEAGSTCFIVVPKDADVSILKRIVGGKDDQSFDGIPTLGRLRISGPGTLHLDASAYDSSELTIDGTTVWCSQSQDLPYVSYGFGAVTVTNGATLHLPVRHDGLKAGGANFVSMHQLNGDGLVEAAETTEVRFSAAGGWFTGVLGKKVGLFASGFQCLAGTNSPMQGKTFPKVYGARTNWSTGDGILGVMKFGRKDEDTSSIGPGDRFASDVNGGTYLYLGKGEVTDKYFAIYPCSTGYSTLDGGAFGGLEFVNDGGVAFRSTANGLNTVLGLNGSNTTACVFRGQYNEFNALALLSTVKKGTGTWRFADPAKDGLNVADCRDFRGTISVDEGVLQFDTIDLPGEYCSVGLATMLKPPLLGAFADLPDVDWAFSLGGTNASLTALAEGTLEYTGTNAALCVERRVRLEADGRFRANGPKIRYRMAESTSARPKTLSLDGSSPEESEVFDVVDDAENRVSIVKEGSGTWALSGKHPLHGDLTVKEGTLIVREYPVGSPYSWFRFTIKNLFDPVNPSSAKGPVSMRFLGLYDADGYAQSLDAAEAEGTYVDRPLDPGKCFYGKRVVHGRGGCGGSSDDNVTNLFSTARIFDVSLNNAKTGASFYPQADDESTWLPLVVRLTNGAPAIASFDWVTTYGWASSNNAGFRWMPNRWSLEGSIDGIRWENVKPDGGDYVLATNDCEAVSHDNFFVGSGYACDVNMQVRSARNPRWHNQGFGIRGTATNGCEVLKYVNAVRVDKGATLKIENAGSEIKCLRVDAQNGAGTIKGAKFAAAGEIELLGYRPGTKSLSLGLVDADGEGNITDWNVKIDGKDKPTYQVRYTNGELKIVPPGVLLIVR